MKMTTKVKVRERIAQVKMQGITIITHTPTQSEWRNHGQPDTPQTKELGQVVTCMNRESGKAHLKNQLSRKGHWRSQKRVQLQ